MSQAITHNQSVRQDEMGRQDKTKFWLDSRFDNLECLHAQFIHHSYVPHSHDTYVFGFVERGAEFCRSRGCDFLLTPGRVTIINPGDVHDGRPDKDGYIYRMFYPSTSLMKRAMLDVSDGAKDDVPWFSNSVLDDPDLISHLVQAHHLSESGGNNLATEVSMLEAMATVIRRYADDSPELLRIGAEKTAINVVQDYMNDNIDTEIKLDDLSAEVSLNRFQLIRSFKKETGQTPHAYLMNQRINRAKQYMKKGTSLAETALACGFYDQSHMNKVFKSLLRFTPGEFKTAVCNSIQ